MLARTACGWGKGSVSLGCSTPARGRKARFEPESKERIVSVKNIEKITKTMKMIASSRLKAAQTKMEIGRPFCESAARILQVVPATHKEGKNLIVAVSADRGLCGAINSSIAKYVRDLLKSRPDSKIVTIGDRAASLLGRDQGDKILFAAGDLGKGFTYDMAAILADRIVSLDEKFDNVVIVFNRFNSVVSYTVTEINMDTFMHLQNRPEFNVYGFEENAKLDHLQDYFEFQLSSAIYNAVIESNASELGARMTAMDNASKNAKEMLRLLNISYNRGRQAAITTELSEIIGGASAVEAASGK